MIELLCLDPGGLATIQDRGRFGWQRFGVTPAGPMDRLSFEAAVALSGTDHAIELTLFGGRWAVEGGPARIALTPALTAKVDGQPVPLLTTLTLQPGQTLSLGGGPVRAYLAIEGGFAVEPVLGSRSVHVRSRLGWPGRALVAGDRIRLAAAPAAGPERRLPADACDLSPRRVRVVLGPQEDLFTPAGIATFLSETFVVSPEADRMGYRLDGPVIEHAGDYNLVSDGIVIGSVQVPGNGRPIVLLADRQSTGGYPKIATVIGADLPLIARCKPGDSLLFEAIDVAAARAAAIAFSQRLAALPGLVTQGAVVWDQTSERLLGLQLIDGAVSAQP